MPVAVVVVWCGVVCKMLLDVFFAHSTFVSFCFVLVLFCFVLVMVVPMSA